MSEDEKQLVACHGFVIGSENHYVPGNYHEFLAAIDEIAVARDENALWNSRRYDSRLQHLFTKKFETLRAPVGPTDYVTRVRLHGGTIETIRCEEDPVVLGRRQDQGGRYYRLKRTSAVAARWPREIEVYVEANWSVTYDVGIPMTAVRFSTDGKRFRTVRSEEGIDIDDPVANRLVLRFVTEDGNEVEYDGTIDYAEQRFSALRDLLFKEGRFTCRAAEESPFLCDFQRRSSPDLFGGSFLKEVVLPVVRSIAFGCARDRLEYRDRLADERERAETHRGEDMVSFSVPRACETVYARFTLENGTESDLLIAPVSTEDR